MNGRIEIPEPGSRAALVWAKGAAHRAADCLAVAFWTEEEFQRREAIEALADAARHLGFQLVPVAASKPEVAA